MATTSMAALRASALRRFRPSSVSMPFRGIATSALRLSSSQPPRMVPEDAPREMDVGELQGAKFRVEPLRRTGEDDNTKRARLVCKFVVLGSFVRVLAGSCPLFTRAWAFQMQSIDSHPMPPL